MYDKIISIGAKAIGFVLGDKIKLFASVAVVAGVIFSGWYLYDDIFVEPLEESKKETVECRDELSKANFLIIDMIKEFDANISTLQASIKKCNRDIAIYSLESFEQGRLQGIKDAEANKTVSPTDIDAICFQPYF